MEMERDGFKTEIPCFSCLTADSLMQCFSGGEARANGQLFMCVCLYVCACVYSTSAVTAVHLLTQEHNLMEINGAAPLFWLY